MAAKELETETSGRTMGTREEEERSTTTVASTKAHRTGLGGTTARREGRGEEAEGAVEDLRPGS